MWTIDAPAEAASSAEAAISAGVTGTAGFFFGVSDEPVTAQVIMTFWRDIAGRAFPLCPYDKLFVSDHVIRYQRLRLRRWG